ncbi:hypothetical protein GWI33_018964 [Rhynchophorus ferrugineus]|uniref:Uncharacterized protein n=1 Tax=Rhynchophorus ferrugineus TaxID=354439 RepID=A0A834I6A1_RHYFE|nr:hypothetical protein GWI33_018964 [Rhynchophorus ferrugineus]
MPLNANFQLRPSKASGPANQLTQMIGTGKKYEWQELCQCRVTVWNSIRTPGLLLRGPPPYPPGADSAWPNLITLLKRAEPPADRGQWSLHSGMEKQRMRKKESRSNVTGGVEKK